MTSIDNMKIFMRTVELGSLSAAGRELRLSAAVVSYRLQVLEEHLGCRLLTRTTRRMSLTNQGSVFYERCLEVVEAVERAEASVAESGASPRGAIKVTAPLGFGRRVMAPLASRFRQMHPETEVRLRLSDHLLDLVQESIDIAVRLARLEDSSFTMRKVANVERVICAAPSYIEREGAPETPEDLLRHRCLLLRFPGSHQYRWPMLKKGEDVSEPHEKALSLPVSGPMDADDGDVLTNWALDGHGLILKPLFEVAEHIASGALLPLMPDYAPLPLTLAILYPTRRMLPMRSRDFIELTVEASRAAMNKSLGLVGKSLS